MLKSKLKSGDIVRVITGKYRGIIDYISKIDPENQVVYLKKANKKKYDKSTEKKRKSELKEIMVPIHVSNVAYWLEDKKQITKIGFQELEGKKVRKSRKYNITVK